jgi:hypothetical protein
MHASARLRRGTIVCSVFAVLYDRTVVVHADQSTAEWVRDEYLSQPHSHFRDPHHPDYIRHYEYVTQYVHLLWPRRHRFPEVLFGLQPQGSRSGEGSGAPGKRRSR